MANRGYALSRHQLVSTLTAWEGFTTANGDATGITLVDTLLIGKTIPSIKEKMVLIMSGPCENEDQPAVDFDAVNGIITFPAFSAQITAGTQYRVINISSVELDILNIMTMLGQKSGALAYLGYCPTGMVASATDIRCPNLIGFGDAAFASNFEMMVVKNANNLHLPPEMEVRTITTYTSATGLFVVPAFSAQVEASDIVIVCHISVMSRISVLSWTDAASTINFIRDALRTEANDWWNGQTVMLLNGVNKGQVRAIVDFVNATGDIYVSPPFPNAPGVNDTYIIISGLNPIVPAIDGALNYLTSEVIGNKADTAKIVADNTASEISYLKGLINQIAAIVAGSTDIAAIETKLDGEPALITLFNTTTTIINDLVTLFQIDALGGTRRNIELNFYLALDAAATFLLTITKTRPGDLATFTQDEELDDTIIMPGANRNHSYPLGDLAEGLQLRVIIAQDNAGNANNVCDAELTYEG